MLSNMFLGVFPDIRTHSPPIVTQKTFMDLLTVIMTFTWLVSNPITLFHSKFSFFRRVYLESPNKVVVKYNVNIIVFFFNKCSGLGLYFFFLAVCEGNPVDLKFLYPLYMPKITQDVHVFLHNLRN